MATPVDHKSPVVPSVLFKDGIDQSVVIPYVERRAARFFKAQKGIEDLSRVHRVRQRNVITDLDWKSRGEDRFIKFEYIYRVVMRKAQKKDGRTQQMAYAVTFDRTLTPKQCEKTGIFYDEMKLAGEPILYYLRIDLGDLITKVREYIK